MMNSGRSDKVILEWQMCVLLIRLIRFRGNLPGLSRQDTSVEYLRNVDISACSSRNHGNLGIAAPRATGISDLLLLTKASVNSELLPRSHLGLGDAPSGTF